MHLVKKLQLAMWRGWRKRRQIDGRHATAELPQKQQIETSKDGNSNKNETYLSNKRDESLFDALGPDVQTV